MGVHSVLESCKPACDANPDSMQPMYVVPQHVGPPYGRTASTWKDSDVSQQEQVLSVLQCLIGDALPAADIKKLELPGGMAGCEADVRWGSGADYLLGSWRSHHQFHHQSVKLFNQAYCDATWNALPKDDEEIITGSWSDSIQCPRPMSEEPSFQPEHIHGKPLGKKKPPCDQQLNPNRKGGPLRIATHLVALEAEDADKVVVVRKIHKLGLGSADILSQHYSKYGNVTKVLLSSTNEKQERGIRLRPAGIGWLLFERSESASAALAAGECQTVAGASILVRPFASVSTTNNDRVNVDISEQGSTGSKRSMSDSEGSESISSG